MSETLTYCLRLGSFLSENRIEGEKKCILGFPIALQSFYSIESIAGYYDDSHLMTSGGVIQQSFLEWERLMSSLAKHEGVLRL